jgi:hypothetical protein
MEIGEIASKLPRTRGDGETPDAPVLRNKNRKISNEM